MHDDVETRLRLVEAEQKVNSLRMDELEAWRRRDEPRIAELTTAAQVAREVRAALADARRVEWRLWQKAAAAAVGGVTLAGGVASFLKAIGVL